MIWNFEVGLKQDLPDPNKDEIMNALADLEISFVKNVRSILKYHIESNDDAAAIVNFLEKVLPDPVVNSYAINETLKYPEMKFNHVITIYKKPGVMDSVEESIKKAGRDFGVNISAVKTGRKYLVSADANNEEILSFASKLLANEVIEDIFIGEHQITDFTGGNEYEFKKKIVNFTSLNDDELLEINKEYTLSLSLHEMYVIQKYFSELEREPTDIELETIAQSWSEHCCHKTLTGNIKVGDKVINNLLKSTIAKATNELNKDWCVSVFEDNAGIIKFDEEDGLAFKVETHNHPSAIEPYGGAGTGIGGVIRDILGCGLGAMPVASTDVFCVANPDITYKNLPKGVLHPKRILKGVVSGVRDYGNRMGIPTVNGTVVFDERFIGNPLVFCGNIGIIPLNKCLKKVEPGDLIVSIGGRTGRDGIHGATFSSVELTEESESVSSGAVQIGNPIMEKKVRDVILRARDEELYSCITDCGAGGFSSAVGEMGENSGAIVELSEVPLKYNGLSYSEIWISEAQERMVLAVPPAKLEKLLEICENEDVEGTVIGEFTNTKKLEVKYNNNTVCNLDMNFLHNGVPKLNRSAMGSEYKETEPEIKIETINLYEDFLKVLSSYNVCSKEWIVRQYDHEVQAGSIIKPFTGVENDGPGDASVFKPKYNSKKCVAVGCGINPFYGDIDPYYMTLAVIDEAIRNVVAVGGNPNYTAILDNFSWGNPDKPEELERLVRACEACYDGAMAYKTPFISGKDSLNNEFKIGNKTVVIPGTLLISAMSVINDDSKTITMSFKEVGNPIYIVGLTKDELGGSEFYRQKGFVGLNVPKTDLTTAPKIMNGIYESIQAELLNSAHDLSEGGLAVALAESAFSGNVGASIQLDSIPINSDLEDYKILFSESTSRFIVEVKKGKEDKLLDIMKGLPIAKIGITSEEKSLVIKNNENVIFNEDLSTLKKVWKDKMKGW